MKKVLIIAAVLAVLAVVGFVATGSSNNEEPAFKTLAVGRSNIVDKALAVGEIVPRQEVQVKSRISGIVKVLNAEVGDRVRAGEPLLVISPNPTPLEYAEAKRNVQLAQVDVDNATKVSQRYKGLYEKKLISAEEYEIHSTELSAAQVRYELSVEKLDLLQKGVPTR